MAVSMWDCATGRPLRRLEGHVGTVVAMCWLDGGNRVRGTGVIGAGEMGKRCRWWMFETSVGSCLAAF